MHMGLVEMDESHVGGARKGKRDRVASPAALTSLAASYTATLATPGRLPMLKLTASLSRREK